MARPTPRAGHRTADPPVTGKATGTTSLACLAPALLDHDIALPEGADPVAAAHRFASPLTRMLLSSDGLTTTLLAAWAGEPVHVCRVCLRPLRAGSVSSGAAALLRPDGHGDLLVRHSALATSRHRVLSLNHVMARTGLSPLLDGCLADASTPLGPALHAAGIGLRRTLVDAGHVLWPLRSQAPAAYKTYLLWYGDEVMAAIREVFNPAYVPAAAQGEE